MASDVAYAELERILERHGWRLARIKGSHHVFTGPDRPTISIPVHRGKVKHVYKRRIEKAIKELEEDDA